jgi:hypothetical protein
MPKNPDAIFNWLNARNELAQMRREVQKAEKEADRPTLYLPEPPHQDTRPAPNGVLRSALFAALGKRPRQTFTRETLPSLSNIDVKFTGEQLDQMDLDLWLVLFHLGRRTPLGLVNRLSSYALLKALDLGDDGRTREDLKASLVRLSSCTVELKQGREWFIGGLVDSVARTDNGECWCIRLSPELTKLLGPADWTAVYWPVRRALRGKPLAQWLHGYFSSHVKANLIGARLLRELSGSKAELRSFSSTLRRALTAVETASIAHNQFFKWSINRGLIDVQTKPDLQLKRA